MSLNKILSVYYPFICIICIFRRGNYADRQSLKGLEIDKIAGIVHNAI